MRLVLQRVSSAKVEVSGRIVGEVDTGLLLLLGIENGDGRDDMDWGVKKTAELRIFQDSNDKMNLCVEEIGGEVLVVSQFTLLGDAKKGRRPSFVEAAAPEVAKPLFDYFVDKLRGRGIVTATGQFAARMTVTLVNEGPVTIILERRHPSPEG